VSEYTEYFLNAPASVIQFECLEISHPNFTKTYYIVRNAADGITVQHEDGTTVNYLYYPARIRSKGARDDLDVIYDIDLGDLGEVFPLEFDAVAAAGGFNVKPSLKFRTYRSDDLTVPMYGPLSLEIVRLSHNEDGMSFEAKAPELNINKTGEVYSLDRFTGLRGFL
jgi:hypothetical protein